MASYISASVPHNEINNLLKSISATQRTHLIGVYSLGKAQRVISLLREAGYDHPIFIHGALEKLCDYYLSEGINLGLLRKALVQDKETMKGAVVMAPPSALRDRWSRRLMDPIISQASGWMTIKQRAKRSGVELPLIISDHADWNELTSTIGQHGSRYNLGTHGREDALVHWCKLNGKMQSHCVYKDAMRNLRYEEVLATLSHAYFENFSQ
ncbi:MAG: hypothetical protein CM15mP62_25910 [Rhodospirillaceae bacterium]|nr:MAG: hypothetical protein CM15mP62_25910 [Rhodospirillaceae bacterium]